MKVGGEERGSKGNTRCHSGRAPPDLSGRESRKPVTSPNPHVRRAGAPSPSRWLLDAPLARGTTAERWFELARRRYPPARADGRRITLALIRPRLIGPALIRMESETLPSELAFTGMRRNLRLASGLVLFIYIALHLLKPRARADLARCRGERSGARGRALVQPARHAAALWRVRGAFPAGAGAVYERRTFRLPPAELLRIALGFALPILLIGHAANTRLAYDLFGLASDYARVISNLWASGAQGQQLGLLAPGWLHGCLGLHFAFNRRPLYRQLRYVLFGAALLLPTLSALGFIAMGRELAGNPAAAATSITASATSLMTSKRDAAPALPAVAPRVDPSRSASLGSARATCSAGTRPAAKPHSAGDREGKREHGGIEANRREPREVGWCERREHAQQSCRERQAERAAADREQHGLCDQLTQQPRTAGAKCRAHGARPADRHRPAVGRHVSRVAAGRSAGCSARRPRRCSSRSRSIWSASPSARCSTARCPTATAAGRCCWSRSASICVGGARLRAGAVDRDADRGARSAGGRRRPARSCWRARWCATCTRARASAARCRGWRRSWRSRRWSRR